MCDPIILEYAHNTPLNPSPLSSVWYVLTYTLYIKELCQMLILRGVLKSGEKW